MSKRLNTSKIQSLNLPPPELRLISPEYDGKIETPIDSRGLVDVPELIKQVRATVDPSYRWESQFNDIHHLQWPSKDYGSFLSIDTSPQIFRNLAISKLNAPRSFHNWTHKVTEPPPVPSAESMHYRTEAQRVTLALFKSVRTSKMLMRNKHISKEALQNRLIQNFDEFSLKLELAQSIPTEFRLVDVSNFTPRNTYDLLKIGAKLGKVATTPTFTDRLLLPISA